MDSTGFAWYCVVLLCMLTDFVVAIFPPAENMGKMCSIVFWAQVFELEVFSGISLLSNHSAL